MAEKKPLVQSNGIVTELQSGDTLPNSSLPLKTINNNSLYGTGNISISGGGGTNYLADYGLIVDTITTTNDYGSLT